MTTLPSSRNLSSLACLSSSELSTVLTAAGYSHSKFDAVRTFAVVCLAVGVWDWLALLPFEYRFIWRSKKWNALNAAFIVNRYWCIATMTYWTASLYGGYEEEYCDRAVWYLLVNVACTSIASASILALRLYVIWQRKKLAAYTMTTWFTLQLTLMLLLTSKLEAVLLDPIVQEFLHFRGCAISSTAGRIRMLDFWTLPFSVVGIAFSFIAASNILRRNNTSTPVLSLLHRQGLHYYLIAFLCLLLNLVFASLWDGTLQGFFGPVALVVPSLMSARLVLFLHQNNDPFTVFPPSLVSPCIRHRRRAASLGTSAVQLDLDRSEPAADESTFPTPPATALPLLPLHHPPDSAATITGGFTLAPFPAQCEDGQQEELETADGAPSPLAVLRSTASTPGQRPSTGSSRYADPLPLSSSREVLNASSRAIFVLEEEEKEEASTTTTGRGLVRQSTRPRCRSEKEEKVERRVGWEEVLAEKGDEQGREEGEKEEGEKRV
ncbi:hypothetical protein JCM8547_007272 [Rhodosporidiobolus lusitaniae]